MHGEDRRPSSDNAFLVNVLASVWNTQSMNDLETAGTLDGDLRNADGDWTRRLRTNGTKWRWQLRSIVVV